MIRIQRKRTKGFKLPPGTLCCTRGTVFGNPFKIGSFFFRENGFVWVGDKEKEDNRNKNLTQVRDAKHAVELFREWRKLVPFKPKDLARLRSASALACYCPPEAPCHVDVLIEILNEKQ